MSVNDYYELTGLFLEKYASCIAVDLEISHLLPNFS